MTLFLKNLTLIADGLFLLRLYVVLSVEKKGKGV